MKKKKTLDLRKKTGSSTLKKNKNGQIIINKCWSVLRMFAEHEFFTGELIKIIE
jgi:hypothetical protein